MRSGGYTLHHSLTVEAAAIVKQALTLARRRGHAQVSPLHVASSMLASPAGLLRKACLQLHSHPLQCKALELCFNVALNRLPTSATTPLLGPPSHLPSLSNALVAAFKRAQAHQRRGSVDQQQPILALKVEIQQLVISILDDPSVSRVMREAGFSSTQVKSNVEKCSSQPPPTTIHQSSKEAVNLSQFRSKEASNLENHDVITVLEAMADDRKMRNTVIVGECASTNESLIKKVIEKFDKNDVPHEMKSVQFISVPLFTLRNISKQEFEVKLGELRSLVKSYVGRGVVLYLGDLDWVSEFWSKYGEQRNIFHSHVECMIMELGRLVSATATEETYNRRLWLMGIATFQTYERCKSGRPSLETLWSLNPLTLPSKGLALRLSLDCMHGDRDQVKREPLDDCNWLMGIKERLDCCSDCEENFKKEAESAMSSSTSRLPPWLQQVKDENGKQVNELQESSKLADLCKKWNSICCSVHKKLHFLEKVMSSSSPSSTSVSSNDHHKSNILLNRPTIFEGEFSKPELLSNPNSSPNSASSSEASDDTKHKFDELNPDNLEILTAALEEKVPWQKHIIPEIVTAILKCRSRKIRRESWLYFLGSDHNGKEIMARELAKIVYGSHDEFVAIGMSSFSSITDSADEVASRKKRARDEHGGSVYDRFIEAVRHNPSRVFYVEDVDRLERRCLKQFERALGNDSVLVGDDGEILLLRDAIIIFSKSEKDEENDDHERQRGSLDLNVDTEDGILDLVDMQVVFRITV